MSIDESNPTVGHVKPEGPSSWLERLSLLHPHEVPTMNWSASSQDELRRRVADFRVLAQVCLTFPLSAATHSALEEQAQRAWTKIMRRGRTALKPRESLESLENTWQMFRDILRQEGFLIRHEGGRLHVRTPAAQEPQAKLAPGEMTRLVRQETAIRELKTAVKRIEDAMDETLLRRIQSIAKEIEDNREHLARMVADAGQHATVIKVGDYHRSFAQTAKRHRDEATTWLQRTVALAISTLVISVGLLLLGYWGPRNPESELGVIVGKSAIMVVLVSATVWAGLNYRSHLHNAVVNEHRGDALGSYDAFSAAAESPTAKDTILVQATGAIYAHQPSGFVAHDGDTATAGIGILGAVLAARGDKAP